MWGLNAVASFTTLAKPAVLGVLLASSNVVAADDASVIYIPPEKVRTLETAHLAARLLPDALAARATSHEITKSRILSNEPLRIAGVRFQLDARWLEPGICRRDDAYVALTLVQPPVPQAEPVGSTVESDGLLRTDGNAPTATIKIALTQQCGNQPEQRYAQLRYGVELAEAVGILRWFEALRAAAATGALTTPVACWSELSDSVPDPCKTDLVALLAQAPLERASSIEVDRKTKDAVVTIVFTRGEPRPYSRLVLKRVGQAPYQVRIGLTHIPPF